MNSRERVVRAIEHREPDRIPLEGAAWGGWSYPFLQNILLPYFAQSAKEVRALGSSESLKMLMDHLGIDFRSVSMDPPLDFQHKAKYDPCFHKPWGLQVNQDTLQDEWGIIRQLNAAKTQSRVIHHPLEGKDDLYDFHFPDPDAQGRFDSAEKGVKRWKEKYAVSAIWAENGFFSHSWFLRGFNQLIRDMYSNPRFVEKLMDRLLEFYLKAGRRLVEIGADIICIADDVGMQSGMILSPQMWRKYVKPRMKVLIGNIKRKGVYMLYHSDGNIEEIVPDLIEVGVDILHPVQPECMDPAEIKQRYGHQLTLAGTISVQENLVRGSVDDVEREVLTRIRSCGQSGGFILAPSNQVMMDVRIENFLRIYSSAKEFGKYPLR